MVVLDLALVALVFVGVHYRWSFIVFSRTPYLFALAWISMWLRGVDWRDLGLRLDPGWPRLATVGIAAGLAMEALELFAIQPLLVRLTGHYPNLSQFKELVGNPTVLLEAIAVSWILAALGEELVWRGHVMNRLADLFGPNRWGWAASLLLANAAFGYAHVYQGTTGMVENFIDGAMLGALYLASGRNLWVSIVAHGMTDTHSLIVFTGHYPGMH
jgi:CAAX protease family protein